ncbi:hypothetical protein [Brevifollis gellanilyticus]|uniref:Organic solvent tolerance-like N-terminal domain-containing protein n=1 Tax=Brevifollis gellanilyticus TaxID=748831 RepID=A0A512MDC4_9BACT|nr:hypothetical protein [Brevifollis gellanilyticus]GEP44734.1 hypothetical protein BGE01nite_40250 [Brevifollis gellanilyticus]
MSKSSFHHPRLVSGFLVLLATALLSQTVVEEKEDSMSAVGKMIPAGFVNKDVIIPSFDETGKKTSELQAATLTRIDEEHLQATKVIIDLLADDPTQNVRVDLPSALFNLNDRILRSGERGTVTRSDLETSGDTLVFDSRTSIGSMTGRVRTLIFDTSAVSNETTPPIQPAPKAEN